MPLCLSGSLMALVAVATEAARISGASALTNSEFRQTQSVARDTVPGSGNPVEISNQLQGPDAVKEGSAARRRRCAGARTMATYAATTALDESAVAGD